MPLAVKEVLHRFFRLYRRCELVRDRREGRRFSELEVRRPAASAFAVVLRDGREQGVIVDP